MAPLKHILSSFKYIQDNFLLYIKQENKESYTVLVSHRVKFHGIGKFGCPLMIKEKISLFLVLETYRKFYYLFLFY